MPTVAMLVSIGTGKAAPRSRFGGLRHLMFWAKTQIIDTESAHQSTRACAEKVAYYERFDEPHNSKRHKGLAGIKLDACNKKEEATINNQVDSDAEDDPLKQAATERHPGGYKPDKYTTFDKTRKRTMQYCDTNDVEENITTRINLCAKMLRNYSRRRRENNPQRWGNFTKHPHSQYHDTSRMNERNIIIMLVCGHLEPVIAA